MATTSLPVAVPDSRLARDATELIRSVELDVLGLGFDDIAAEDRDAVLAEKLPGYERPNFCAIIRASKHTN